MTPRRRSPDTRSPQISGVPAITGSLGARDLSRLCLRCGLCCNGVLFPVVCLVRDDDPVALTTAGLNLVPSPSARGSQSSRLRTPAAGDAVLLPWRFQQPCAALGADNACRLYAIRPARCRGFECAVFQRLKAGSISPASAERIIAATLRQVRRVDRILRRFGEVNDRRPLFARVQTVRRRLDRQVPDRRQAEEYADLTLAALELRVTLERDFAERPSRPTARRLRV